MASFPQLTVISWSPNDPVTAEKLNIMVNNDSLLDQNMIRGFYKGAPVKSVSIQQNLRIACGLVVIGANSKSASAAKEVALGDFFSQGCMPIVTTGVVSSDQRQISDTLDGPGAAPLPNRNGFTIHVYVTSSNKKKKITKTFYVNWIAMGH